MTKSIRPGKRIGGSPEFPDDIKTLSCWWCYKDTISSPTSLLIISQGTSNFTCYSVSKDDKFSTEDHNNLYCLNYFAHDRWLCHFYSFPEKKKSLFLKAFAV
ncbi:hypothetical protein Pfo_022761 [Paulownia fortunei]|nr:hypothetical protein Pfo_022761 [Paulownia fortunei]